MSDDIKEKIQNALDEVNRQQEVIRKQEGYNPCQFVAHATHVSQDEFRKSVPNVYEGFPAGSEIVPAFEKATQNELSTFKDLLPLLFEKGSLSNLSKDELEQLRQSMPKPPARVFAIATKQDDNGNPVFDEKGVPVPQDGSYAYSLKKCSASISFVDGVPLLIGFQEKYADFESGEKSGHIYIGKGDSFKPEYDKNGNITELTSAEDMKVDYHIKTSPKEAMQHNVQFVMFGSEKDYNAWAEDVKKHEKSFETFISSDNYRITSLQKEILNGRATFINATPRGLNPKISGLTMATAERNKMAKSYER